MALDLVGKKMSTGQVVLSTYEVDDNAVRVTMVASDPASGLATEATQLDVLAAIEALDAETSLTPISTPLYRDYTSSPVTTAAYSQLVASTAAEINNIEIFDSSGQALYIAIGAAASEVNRVIVVPGGNGRIPFNIPAGSRISIKAITADATSGFLAINYYA